MRVRTTTWFEATVRYERQSEEGGQTMVNELYVVDAISFAEAEEMITKELQAFVSGEFRIKNITPASYGEVYFSDFESDDKWYKAKLTFVTIDEKTSKEKRTSTYRLVQAATLTSAVSNIEDVMGKGATDYIIANIAETKVLDVFEHNTSLKKDEPNDKPEYEAQDSPKEGE